MKIRRHTNGVFYASVFTVIGTRRISLKTRDEAEAHRLARESKLAELEAAAKANALTAETVGRIVTGRKQTGDEVRAAWLDWTRIAGLAPNTVSAYDGCVSLFLRESGCGSRSLAALSERDVDAFVNPTASGITANTRRNRLAALNSFFGFAHAKGLMIGNPAALVRVRFAGLTFAQKEGKQRVPFTDDEMARLRTVEHVFWRTFVLLGEAYGLRLSDVAMLERDCITTGDRMTVWCDKTDRRLELPLNADVREHLQIVALASPHPKFFFPREATIATDPKRRATLSVEFGRLLRRLGIHGKSAHCLRHTHASKRAALGESVDQIRLRLGHATESVTRGYIHAA